MNTDLSQRGKALVLLTATGCFSFLAATSLTVRSADSPLPLTNNVASFADAELPADVGCPYPPKTPAAAGSQPELRSFIVLPPPSPIKPALYYEEIQPGTKDARPKIVI